MKVHDGDMSNEEILTGFFDSTKVLAVFSFEYGVNYML
jgi:hypothetical protein